ncbi:GNAT family N-acetyltransferase [Kiloniella laminariae]|uniref:GNAT family N-acetyltransferase n=1 Tax=Kiloniella laminariae TaxID=454162 RepID=A0ABT4LEN4_9PROT|nr:GNAT family N-acetyltransferase [Kiloniella laminariae]MCZ4279559.1 GNAT family N-acetyltransferase [Kiloniella laminariae]
MPNATLSTDKLPYHLRPATDNDSAAAIDLVQRSYAEYTDQGVVFDLEEESDLKQLATAFDQAGGEIFALTPSNQPTVLASIGGYQNTADGRLEVKKLYVCPNHRGQGAGKRLLDHIINRAKSSSAQELMLWTDTRFTKAHRLYEKYGFTKGPVTRQLQDKSNTEEFSYHLAL